MNVQAQITGNHTEILKAEKILLPGVGHFANGMKKLEDSGILMGIGLIVWSEELMTIFSRIS